MGHLLFVADFLPTVSLQLSLWSVWPDISLAPSHFMYWQCWQGPGLNNLAISYKALNTQWRHSTIARCWEWTFLLIPTSHNTDGGSSIVSSIHVPWTHEQGSIAVLLIYWACSTRAALSSQLSPPHSVQTVQWLWLYRHNSSGTSLHSSTGIINPLSAPSEWETSPEMCIISMANQEPRTKARQYRSYMCWCLYAILFCTLDIAPDSASAIWPKMHISWRITSLHRAVIVIVMLGSQYGLITAPLHKHLNTHLGTNCCQAQGTDSYS